MNPLFKKAAFYFIIFASFALTNCKKDEPTISNEGSNSVTLYFENRVGESSLTLDNQSNTTPPPSTFLGSYVNAASNKFTISSLRYIISNVILAKSDGTSWSEPDSYHLIEVTNSNTREEFELKKVPGGNYSKITFTLGVDTTVNHSLDKAAGDLVDISDMIWTWDTGYIFYKLEGRYQKADGSYTSYEYQIGSDANSKNISFDLPTPATVSKNIGPELHFKTNVLATFGIAEVASSTIIDILTYPSIVNGAAISTNIANNNAGAFFKIDHLHNESTE